MRLPRRPLAFVFDMDGLLFDTEKLYRDAFFDAARILGHAISEPQFLAMVGSPWRSNRAYLLTEFGADFPVDALREEAHRLMAERTAIAPFLKAGVIELLDALDAAGLPRAIATSSNHGAVAHNLGLHTLEERFHAVIADGDYAQGKPAPDPFLTAAERLGIAPQDCVALEDSYHGVRAASAAGMMAIMVPDLLAATPEIAALCTHVAADLHEVRMMLLATLAHA